MESATSSLETIRKESVESIDEPLNSTKESSTDVKNDAVPKLWSKSRKITKKRNKYQKIDDEIRLKLVEAVEKNGEMLKTAAKRFKINYSSAKSIFHTYRKEGRILKKLVKDRYKKKITQTPPSKTSSNSSYGMHTQSQKQANSPQLQNLQNLNNMPNLLQSPVSNPSLISNLLLNSPLPMASPSNAQLLNNANGSEQGMSGYNKTMEILMALKKLQHLQQQRINIGGINGISDKIKGQALCSPNSSLTNGSHHNIFQNPLQSSLQNNVSTTVNTPKSFSFESAAQNILNNSNHNGQRQQHNNSNNNMGFTPKHNYLDLEAILEGLKQQQHLGKMSADSNKMEIEEDQQPPHMIQQPTPRKSSYAEFECKKEATSKGDMIEESYAPENNNNSQFNTPSSNKNKMEGNNILRPEAIKEHNNNNSNLILQHMESTTNSLPSLKIQKAASEDTTFKNTLETAAMDTIKTALSAQLMLGEALKKAALLNNLMNLQVNCGK
jgi:hypothetical protein